MIKHTFSEAFMEISMGLACIILSLCIASMGVLCVLSYVGVI